MKFNASGKNTKHVLYKIHRCRHRIPSAASLTVEASLVLPIFLFAVLTIAYAGLLVRTQDEVRHAMTRTVSEASAEAGAGFSDLLKSEPYYRGKLALYLEDSTVTMSLLGSSFLKENEEIDLVVSYTTKLPFPLFGFFHPVFQERVHSRAFVGVDKRDSTEKEDDVIVYITPSGRVYHRDKNCTYLKLSVSQVLFGDIARLRNSGGGLYKPCHRCAGAEPSPDAKVYITNYGDRYHTNRGCSEIKRTIQEILLSEVGNRSPCSKCG